MHVVCADSTMSVFRSRGVVIICLFSVILFGFWRQFGNYMKTTHSATSPTELFPLLNQLFSTDIWIVNVTSNNNLVDHKTMGLKKSVYKPYTIPNTTIVTDTHLKKKITVVNRTINTYNLLSQSLIAIDNQNKTLFITSYSWKGRMGNKMFKYASLLGIARAQGRQMFAPSNFELLKTFKLQHIDVHKGSATWQAVSETGPLHFDVNLMSLPLDDVRISGYLQSLRYFKDVADEVRQEFTFLDSVANAAAMILDDVHSKHRGSLVIGVHARRGDFLRLNKNQGFGIPKKSYFLKAFDWMKAKFPGRNITFLVSSDDLKWCTANLIGTGVIAMPQASPGIHMAVLASCEHMIISGGTFGYWGAWMASGYVLYYTGYMSNNTILGKTLKPKDYYPQLWIGLGD